MFDMEVVVLVAWEVTIDPRIVQVLRDRSLRRTFRERVIFIASNFFVIRIGRHISARHVGPTYYRHLDQYPHEPVYQPVVPIVVP